MPWGQAHRLAREMVLLLPSRDRAAAMVAPETKFCAVRPVIWPKWLVVVWPPWPWQLVLVTMLMAVLKARSGLMPENPAD
ncbi:MAG: hypothetical protein ABS75_00325 [Pelagibacterium sp. SCN 63-23]|nr:MAG: hypothetical protein ABS75_00325 [Pelagibacterium sp. SCN 63-23]